MFNNNSRKIRRFLKSMGFVLVVGFLIAQQSHWQNVRNDARLAAAAKNVVVFSSDLAWLGK